MSAFGNVTVTPVATDLGWGEGPSYLPAEGAFVFTDVAGSRIWQWRPGEAPSVFREPSSHANGTTVDLAGRLVVCEHQARRVTRTGTDGRTMVLADRYEDRPLNSPNDVIVASDGAIWFTDPPYGILRGECGEGASIEQPVAGVYRIDPAGGRIDLMIDCLDKPNGLAFSPDERALYVSDTGYSHRPGGNHHIFRFDVAAGRAGPLTVFKEIVPGACDGLRIDRSGNVWSTAGDGVRCYAADGAPLGHIELGEMTTNLCFLPPPALGLLVTTPSGALVCEVSRWPGGGP